ncbi:MAG: TldD/PmbA family protein [Erysipelotrichaceae bacterium]|nr:TldD/PmbA family protein [Erysipelotrichaceae bacterium]MBQ1315676.1 TldD/PmbA family protein [Erysipelotrichaceae bacterium]MBQ2685275.1 TldD/PmbA family protein [Erysipelotrichaceae bacterium]MBR2791425.1 TldD/PmbA family protein [Erysipelotrichaceae bacterium]
MIARQSEYLLQVKPQLKKLVELLKPHYDYVSVLATDVSGTSFRVSMRNTSISEYPDGERGFVVRVYKDGGYSEYSFTDISDVNELAETIRRTLDEQSAMLEGLGVRKLETPLEYEEKITREFAGEISEELYDLNNDEILNKMKKLRDSGASYPGIIDCMVSFMTEINSKLFLSVNKDLIQSWGVSFVSCALLAFKDGEIQYNNVGDTGWFGSELIEKQECKLGKAYEDLMAMFGAPNIEPGEYEVICTPEATGLIAHEAFGHGVEMDMFVKERAIAKQHMGEKLASTITNMYDGAQGGIEQTASYFFDDEGTISGCTKILDNGYLVSGICDALSAARLHVKPTGNGRRESFERKAYTRMTNTYFGTQNNTVEEMIKSVRYGFLVDGMNSGMEDPKHWGIQCILSRAKEIKDGKLTGKMFTPVVLTGYVPDLLSNISMIGSDLELNGNGHCGKGYKEWVVVSDGGPYIKTKVRLG